MNIIEKYLYNVTSRLPKKERAEVEKELRADIESMLAEDYNNDDLCNVLEQLGDPEILADEYRGEKRYLIGPALYDSYIKILELVGSIAIGLGIFAVFIESVQGAGQGLDLPGLLMNIVFGIVESCVGVFATVTLIFAVLERLRISGKPKTGKWTVDQMEPIPDKRKSISRAGAVVGIVISTVFLLLLYFTPQLLGVHIWENSNLTIIPFFQTEVLQRYYPAIFLLIIAAITVGILKLVAGQWTVKLAVLNGVYNVLTVIVLGTMLYKQDIFNTEFLKGLAKIFEMPLDSFLTGWQSGCLVTIVVILLICVYDSVDGFRRSRM